MDSDWRHSALIRRWYVPLIVALLSMAAMSHVYTTPGVHWARAEVTLVPPAVLGGHTAQLDDWASMIPLTTAAAFQLDDDMPDSFASDDAPFYGVVREGVSIRQLDVGGQWSHHFAAPILIVEVVHGDQQAVEQQLWDTVKEIEEYVSETQAAEVPATERRITTDVNDVVRAHLLPTRTGVAKAWMVIAALGAGLSVAAAYAFDALARRTTSRRGELT